MCARRWTRTGCSPDKWWPASGRCPARTTWKNKFVLFNTIWSKRLQKNELQELYAIKKFCLPPRPRCEPMTVARIWLWIQNPRNQRGSTGWVHLLKFTSTRYSKYERLSFICSCSFGLEGARGERTKLRPTSPNGSKASLYINNWIIQQIILKVITNST